MIFKLAQIISNPEIAETIEALIAAALDAVNPGAAVKKVLKVQPGILHVGSASFQLNAIGRIRLVAIGKAALNMAVGAHEVLGDRIHDGLVITKQIPVGEKTSLPVRIRILQGGHPIPTEESVGAGLALREFLKNGREDDLLLTLISGGGSALVQMPKPGISLEDLRKVNQILIHGGVDIEEMNVVRKHLDEVKGGGYLHLAAPARVASLIISDVKGDRLDTIASGITVPDLSTPAEALEVLERHNLLQNTPPLILRILKEKRSVSVNGEQSGSGGDTQPASNQIILTNATAVDAVSSEAIRRGFYVENLGWILSGEARNIGSQVIARFLSQPLNLKPVCLVGGGETFVQVVGGGQGGRNLEVALGAVTALSGLLNVALVSLATDGEDGQTGFAGAVVSKYTCQMAGVLGLNVENSLAGNDSLRFFEEAGGLIQTGSTGTNVNDLIILLAW